MKVTIKTTDIVSAYDIEGVNAKIIFESLPDVIVVDGEEAVVEDTVVPSAGNPVPEAPVVDDSNVEVTDPAPEQAPE